MSDEQLAQIWHDDHCDSAEYRAVSSCWCCCTECDPDWSGTNPYFGLAQQEIRDRSDGSFFVL